MEDKAPDLHSNAWHPFDLDQAMRDSTGISRFDALQHQKRWNVLKMSARLMLMVITLIALHSSAQAGFMVDITKITCHRAFFIGKNVLSSRSIALWLSGYYNGQHSTPLVDMTTLEQQATRIIGYCRAHRDETLAKAVQAALGKNR